MLITVLLTLFADGWGIEIPQIKWKHLSTKTGALEVPNQGTQQTSSVVCDIDKDGINDFAIGERTTAPAIVWYRYTPKGWKQYIVEDTQMRPEAGAGYHDIDNDGDVDLVFAGDGRSNEVWWWENPYPNFDPKKPWVRRLIKNFGANKHHDLIWGDFDGDGQDELVFWNQGAQILFLAEIPSDPKKTEPWECVPIYTFSNDSEMEQRQTRPYPVFRGVNEHEGLAKIDVDLDGKLDIIGGGRWFKHIQGETFQVNEIDPSYAFSRCAAGDLIKGGRPEVVLAVGDGWAPLVLYQWVEIKNGTGVWTSKELVKEIDCGHSLEVLDFNNDQHLDIWVAEMRLNGGNPDAKNMVLLGDGAGNFEILVISQGFANHESRMVDLDGDGDLDILGKPYGWETPRLDIWLNQGVQ